MSNELRKRRNSELKQMGAERTPQKIREAIRLASKNVGDIERIKKIILEKSRLRKIQ